MSHRSEDDLSETQCSEAGYLSDYSDTTVSNKSHVQGIVIRKRHTKQELDSLRGDRVKNMNSEGDYTITHPLSEPRRRKPKKKIIEKSDTKPFENPVKVIEKSAKRQSWTDSGVSLSRTDQSHCGTIQTEYSNSSRYPSRSEKKLSLGENIENNTDEKSSVKETDSSEFSNNMRRKVLPSIEIENASTTSGEVFCVNRNALRSSIMTDRSSLTHVTVISHNNLNSVLTESEFKKDIETNKKSELISDKSCDNMSQHSSNCILGDKDNSVNDKNAIFTNNTKTGSNANSPHPVDYISFRQITASNDPHVHSKKKSKSFTDYIKKAKNQMRPRFFSEKPYKDVSTEFAFRKMKNDIDTQKELQKLSNNFLQELQDFKITSDKKIKEFSEKLKSNEQTEKDNLLDRLSTKPTKSKNIFRKLFHRSKTYTAAQPTRRINRQQSFHNRNNASSVPDLFLASSHETNKYKVYHNNNNSFLNFKQQGSNIPNQDEYFEYKKPIRTSSLTQLSSYVRKENSFSRANSTPNTPILANKKIPDNCCEPCNCDECAYEEYLDYLSFQEFKRNKEFYMQQMQYNIPMQNDHANVNFETSDPTNNNLVNPIYYREVNNIVAPLSVVKDAERQAKNMKTPVLDSLV